MQTMALTPERDGVVGLRSGENRGGEERRENGQESDHS